MRLHMGRFGMLNFKPWYSVLLAVCTLVLVLRAWGCTPCRPDAGHGPRP
jgi:hypothetical protein